MLPVGPYVYGASLLDRYDKAAKGLADTAKGDVFAILTGRKSCHRGALQTTARTVARIIAYNLGLQKRPPLRGCCRAVSTGRHGRRQI
jgi:hypothetical protein